MADCAGLHKPSLCSNILILPRRVTTIHHQIIPSHETARLAQQEQRSTLELARLSEAAHHVLAAPLLLQFRVLFEGLGYHGRQDVTRADAVDADAAAAVLADGAPFHGQVPGKLDDGGLGRIVDG